MMVFHRGLPQSTEFAGDTQISRETAEPLATLPRHRYLRACGVRVSPRVSLWPLCHPRCPPRATSKEGCGSREQDDVNPL